MQNEQFFCYHGENSLHSMRYFVLDQHAQIDFLQCQCTETTVYSQMIAPPRHNNSMLCLQWRSRKYQFYRLWFDPTGAYPRSAALDESMIAITPVMQFMVQMGIYSAIRQCPRNKNGISCCVVLMITTILKNDDSSHTKT